MKKETKKKVVTKAKNHGGKRAGAGAKTKYGEPTTTIAFRVPNSKKVELKTTIKTHLKKWEVKK